MKTLFVAMAMMAALPVLAAEDATPASQAATELKAILDRIPLSAEEQKQALPILVEEMKQRKEIEANAALKPQQKLTATTMSHQSALSQLKGVLKPEEFDQLAHGLDYRAVVIPHP